MADIAEKRARFRELHQKGCFVIPNPWDLGSGLFLQSLGFQALATTSSGFAFTKGLPDSPDAVPLEATLAHYRELAHGLSIPVSADFQNGYGTSIEELRQSVLACIETGVAGFSIEDSTGRPDQPLFEFEEALDRIRLVRKTIDETGTGVVLTARSECFLVGHPNPLKESIKRLQAFADAGADVLFAPCPAERANIHTIVRELSPKPVNIIMSGYSGLTVGDVVALGARRISVGSALSRAAWSGFIDAATKIANEGSFEGLDKLASFAMLNQFFQDGTGA